MELTLVALILGSALAGAPGVVPLQKITDSTILPPGVSGTFIIGRPESCLGNVFFTAFEDGALIGLYAATPQGLEVIANRTVPFPGSAGTFQNALRPTCAGDRLLFLGDDDLSPLSSGNSVYALNQGVISPVLETGSPIGNTTFEGFTTVDATENEIVVDARLFPASVNQAVVVKPFAGAPFIIADRTTVLPGQTNPATIYARPIFVGSALFFHARTGQNVAIYRWRPGEGITVIADTNTPVPVPGQGSFFAFGLFADLNGRLVFGATFQNGMGIFAFEGGQFEPVVLPGDLTADGATLASAFEPSGGGNLLTFSGNTEEDLREAVFMKDGDAPVRRLLGVGDTFEGRQVHRVLSDADHRGVLVWAENLEPPGFQAIYRVRFGAVATEIPVLSWWGVLALGVGLGLMGWRALRRERAWLRCS